MARYDKLAVLDKMKSTGMVPVFYHPDIKIVKHVVKACYDGGVRVLEFTNRGDMAQDVFAETLRYVWRECPDLALGVGSIIDAPSAAFYIQQGACFVVGPLFNIEVARLCNRRLIPYIPGCGTVSEVGCAQEAGSDLVKLFPGDVYGPRFIKDIMAPMPWSRIMVTGGVEPTCENLASWFNAGAFCVGIGSKLFPHDIIAEGRWNAITAKCREALDYIEEVRKG